MDRSDAVMGRRRLLAGTAGAAGLLALSLSTPAWARPLSRPGIKPTLGAPGGLVLTAQQKAVAEALAAKLRHGLVMGLSSGATVARTGFPRIAHRFMAHMSSKRNAVARSRAKALRAAPLAQRQQLFGRFAAEGMTAHSKKAPVGDLALAKDLAQVAATRDAKLAKVLEKSSASPPKSSGKPKPPKLGPGYKRLRVMLNSVRCVEETDEVGADEILLGGASIDHTGKSTPLSGFKVGNDFDKGETRRFDYLNCQKANVPSGMKGLLCPGGSASDPYLGRQLASFELITPGPWPRVHTVALLMGEEDNGGGFGEMLTAVWEELEDEAENLIQELGSEIGAAIGGAFGQIIGDVIAWAVMIVIGWLIALFDNPDDPIASQVHVVELTSPFQSQIKAMASNPLPAPANVFAAPLQKLVFAGDGGRYEMQLHWRAIA